MASFTGTLPSQVPTNDDLGKFAYLDYLGIQDTGCQSITLASASTISPTTQISTGLFSTSTSGNIALATVAVVSKALIFTYDASTAQWYPSY